MVEDVDKKVRSRKWVLVLLVLSISTIGTFIPPLLSAWVFKAPTPLFILSGVEYVSLITLIISAYFGANVLQKHVLKDEIISVGKKTDKKSETITETKIEKNENGEA